MTYRIELFQDKAGEYRFRIVARHNGQTVLTSEGYSEKTNAYRAIRRMKNSLFKSNAVYLKTI